jgi:6-phosphogluconate dehydrogenase
MAQLIGCFGIVGLGKMGANLAQNALRAGFEIVGVDPKGVPQELAGSALKRASVAELGLLPRPRLVMLYVPAGPLVDRLLDELSQSLEAGDIIADGGNSYWGDSIRRHSQMKKRGLHFIDVGTSGGPEGALKGPCFMVGGERKAVVEIEPVLRKLAVQDGYIHVGGPGAGHFVKLVHNGIEFGMLQSIAEGIDLLTHYRDKLPLADLLKCWQHGSVIRSWLVELMEQMYRRESGLGSVPAYVEDTGEVNWLVDDALHMEVSIPVIAQSVMELIASRDASHNWARAIAMMRHGFGGHPLGPDKGIARERHTGRVGGFVGSSTAAESSAA